MRLTGGASELLGIIIGNGNIYKDRYIEITGHPKADLEYFKEKVIPLVEQELDYSPTKIFFRSGAARFRINNKAFIKSIKALGIPVGRNKSRTVLIPNKVTKNWKHTRRCLRGIFDTDGFVSFDKRKTYLRPYPRVVLHLANLPLVEQIYGLLREQGLNVTISKKEIAVYLNGIIEVKASQDKVGFTNKKHLDKIGRI